MSGVGDLVGKTLKSISLTVDHEEVVMETTCGRAYRMWHSQDCCEHVYLDEVHGDLNDLIGSPVVSAYESASSDTPAKAQYDESHTWTFYTIQTAKGAVTLKWYGTSNGYYSETVDFYQVNAA